MANFCQNLTRFWKWLTMDKLEGKLDEIVKIILKRYKICHVLDEVH